MRNLAELDTLVDEILLSAPLNHAMPGLDREETVDLLGLAAEEAARVAAEVEGEPVILIGDPVLLRRLLRNLLENGTTHGAPPVRVRVEPCVRIRPAPYEGFRVERAALNMSGEFQAAWARVVVSRLAFQRQGSSSSIRLAGWSGSRASTSASQA